jgi:RNA polymerase sigma-70 factor (ECF subfamily)
MGTLTLPAMFEGALPMWTGRAEQVAEKAKRDGESGAARREVSAAAHAPAPMGLATNESLAAGAPLAAGTPAAANMRPAAGFQAPGPVDGRASSPERTAMLAEQKKLAELAARCAGGDGEAWEELARTQHRRIYGICYRFIGSASEAEDLTQDVFIKVFRNIASFDPAKGGFNTWLTTLTRNMLVDNYRRARMDRATDSLNETMDGEEDGPSKLDRLAATGPTQEQHVSGLQLRAQIQEALKQVSPDLREAVILRDLEDMDYKDIAEVLGVPTGTVKSRISRGRSELAKLLKRIEGQVM